MGHQVRNRMEEVHEWIMKIVTEGIHRVYLRQAYIHAQARSQDPNTQNGALIVFPTSGIIAADVNRYPSIRESEGHSKYDYIEHAERSVIFRCVSKGLTTLNTDIYCPFASCPDCARAIVMSGIRRVVGHKTIWDMIPDRWREKCETGVRILEGAGVEYLLYDGKVLNEGEFKIRFDGREIEP
jgi:deoxycytidylate deaminase